MLSGADLRKTLSEQITRLHSKKGDPKETNAICNAAGKIFSSIRLEMDYCKMTGQMPSADFVRHVHTLPPSRKRK